MASQVAMSSRKFQSNILPHGGGLEGPFIFGLLPKDNLGQGTRFSPCVLCFYLPEQTHLSNAYRPCICNLQSARRRHRRRSCRLLAVGDLKKFWIGELAFMSSTCNQAM